MIAVFIVGAIAAAGTGVDVSGPEDAADLARAIESELGVPARVKTSHARFAALRIGTSGGPSVAVVLPPESGSLDAVHRVAAECAKSGLLEDRSILLLVGGPTSHAVMDESTDPALNFPGDWVDARRERGASAGPYPASDRWVRSVVDALIAEQDCAAVIDARVEPDRESAPGSMRRYVESCLHLPFVAMGDGGAAERTKIPGAIRDRLQRIASLSLHEPRWKRVAARTWALDLRLTNRGALATGHEGSATSRRARGCSLELESRGGTYTWSACAAAPLGPRMLRSVEIVRGPARETVRLPDLAGGETVRVRFLLTARDDAPEGVPEVFLSARGARAVGSPRRSFRPATAR